MIKKWQKMAKNGKKMAKNGKKMIFNSIDYASSALSIRTLPL